MAEQAPPQGMSADDERAYWLAHDIFSHESDGRLLFKWGDSVEQRTSMGYWNAQQEEALKESIAGRICFAQAVARADERVEAWNAALKEFDSRAKYLLENWEREGEGMASSSKLHGMDHARRIARAMKLPEAQPVEPTKGEGTQ